MQMLPFLSTQGKKVSKITKVDIAFATRDTSVLFISMPMWATMFPPYNLGRLASLTKQAGFETEIFDFNAEAWNVLERDEGTDLWKVDIDRWRDPKYFNEEIYPVLETFFDECLERVLEHDPDVLAVCEYNFNEYPSHRLIKEIRKWAPHIKIIGGGPNMQFLSKHWHGTKLYDYAVSGEAEISILQVLNEIDSGVEYDDCKIFSNPMNLRIDLNNFPMPDYCGLDMNMYGIPNGINSEFSRGCVAKCTFCSETHFAKYRQRQSTSAFDEIKHFNETQGSTMVYFVDSLINGNLKELKTFAEQMKVFDKKVLWLGYARHDGRMDLDYMQTLADGGCLALNFGCESASQKVLDFMDKKVTVEEMEQNFEDITKVGIMAYTNWISGFPTEKHEDHAKSMTFIHRVRNKNLKNLSLGYGFSPMPDNIVGQNPHNYNLSNYMYAEHWISEDFRVGGPHVLVRVKTMKVFTDLMIVTNPVYDGYTNAARTEAGYVDIKFDDENINNEIEYEDFDYDIIKEDINPFADSLVNEIWPMLRLLWKIRGGYELEFRISPDEFNARQDNGGKGFAKFSATYKFKINSGGLWDADFKFNLTQPDNPFGVEDFSHHESNSSVRAKQLAKPDWGMGSMSEETRQTYFDNASRMNKELDLSFDLEWKQKGNWYV